MSQRNKKKNESILNQKNSWEQLCLDCWICRGCEKRCTVTNLKEPIGCLPEHSEYKHKATLSIKN
jgi:hypothetical protein